MATESNFFKHLEVIEGSSATALTLKLRSLNFAYHLLNVWSDGKKHYAHINANRKLSPRDLERMSRIDGK